MDNQFQIRNALENLLNNSVTSVSQMSRARLAADMNTESRQEKLDYSAGYPIEVTTQMMYDAWKRDGVATRVVRSYPESCWKKAPDVFEDESVDTETAFEASWKAQNERVDVVAAMATADELCGIGRYGIIILGLDDGKELKDPVANFDEDVFNQNPGGTGVNINFMRPMSEQWVEIKDIESDPTSPRYGLPTMYSVRLGGISEAMNDAVNNKLEFFDVHWHRAIHVTDPVDETPVYAPPRMMNVYNDILDLKKICAAGAEGYFQAANPGLTFKLDPGYDEVDTQGIKQQMDDYAENMRRYISTTGVTVDTLAPNVIAPLEFIEAPLTKISIGTGIPKRILTGSEEGRLAGKQDGMNWADRVLARCNNHLTEAVVLRTVRHLQFAGVLAAAPDGVQVLWPDMHTMTKAEQAQIALQHTDAIAKYSMSGAEQLISLGDFLHLVLKMDSGDVTAILDKLPGDDEPGYLHDIQLEETEIKHEQALEGISLKRDLTHSGNSNHEGVDDQGGLKGSKGKPSDEKID
jgi:hypothetical protein